MSPRFDAAEAHGYWREHLARRAPIDFALDPDGLNNVCHPGAPLWLNQYYAHFQNIVFRKLLSHITPDPNRGPRALDLGCGAGRWCRVLAAQGYATTGIDLQEGLIARNRQQFPHIQFLCGSLQDVTEGGDFDLLTSVTVIQHNPPDEQEKLIRHIRRLLVDGGHVLALENVRDQDVHVFSSSIEGWISRFERAGFRCRHICRYDYSPLLRLDRLLALTARRLLRRGRPDRETRDPGTRGLDEPTSRLRRVAGAAHASVLRIATTGDTLVERLLIETNPPLPTVHCGFLFQAT
jgi:SAM-dependent methyltransferase